MPSSDFDRFTFLVADENKHMRNIVKTVLHGFGARHVVEANDGADAFKAMHSIAPDLVITEWNMAPLDGIDFVKLVRTAKDSPNPYVPIIMLSGHTEAHHVAQARDAGIHEFIAKPAAADVMFQRIANVLTRPRPFVKARSYFGPDRRRHHRRPHLGPERRSVEPMLLAPATPFDDVLAPPSTGPAKPRRSVHRVHAPGGHLVPPWRFGPDDRDHGR